MCIEKAPILTISEDEGFLYARRPLPAFGHPPLQGEGFRLPAPSRGRAGEVVNSRERFAMDDDDDTGDANPEEDA